MHEPRSERDEGSARPQQYGLRHEDVFIDAADGSRLHGWWLPARGPAPGSVLHLHGNAANVSNHLPLLSMSMLVLLADTGSSNGGLVARKAVEVAAAKAALPGADAVGWPAMAGNLAPVIAGNLVGGSVLVALVCWVIYLRRR